MIVVSISRRMRFGHRQTVYPDYLCVTAVAP